MPRAKRAKRALSVNEVFAYRLRDARLSKSWKQKDLADAMKRLGEPVSVPTIAKIEAGRHGVGGDYGKEGSPAAFGRKVRDVTLRQAVAFAAALDVSPSSLFLPIVREDDVRLAPSLVVDVDTAHAWCRGERPLDASNDAFYRFQRFAGREQLPAVLAALQQMPGVNITIQGPKEDDQ